MNNKGITYLFYHNYFFRKDRAVKEWQKKWKEKKRKGIRWQVWR